MFKILHVGQETSLLWLELFDDRLYIKDIPTLQH